MEPWGIRMSASVAVPGVRFETVEYLPGHWSERHAHEVAFVDLLLSGAQAARWDGSEVRRVPGTVSLMPVGQAHATESVLPTRTFQVAFDPAWGDGAKGKVGLTGRCAHFGVGPLAWHVTRMWAEFRQRDDLSLTALEERFRTFLDVLQDEIPRPVEGGGRWLRRARAYVRDHARHGFAVSDVAAEVGVNPAHLMRCYVARYGMTMGEDARRLRVAHACRLLANAESSLGEVALASGFTDQSHLTRVFKAHTGLTPRAYRQTCQGR